MIWLENVNFKLKKSEMQKKGFTIVEVIIVLIILSTGLITIIGGISSTTRFISEMRQKTIALNLAKAGIESIYNIRDSNWRRRSANKDECWLKADPLEKNDGNCKDDIWIHKGFWSIEENKLSKKLEKHGNLNGIKRSFSGGWRNKNIFGKLENEEKYKVFKMHFINNKWISNKKLNEMQQEGKETKEITSIGNYYRFIKITGLYKKNGNNNEYLECKKGEGECGNNDAKELRFCSTVIYTRPYQGMVNICSLMTNFLK